MTGAITVAAAAGFSAMKVGAGSAAQSKVSRPSQSDFDEAIATLQDYRIPLDAARHDGWQSFYDDFYFQDEDVPEDGSPPEELVEAVNTFQRGCAYGMMQFSDPDGVLPNAWQALTTFNSAKAGNADGQQVLELIQAYSGANGPPIASWVTRHFTIVGAGAVNTGPVSTFLTWPFDGPRMQPATSATTTVTGFGGNPITSVAGLSRGQSNIAKITIAIPGNWTSEELARYILTQIASNPVVHQIAEDDLASLDSRLFTQFQVQDFQNAATQVAAVAKTYINTLVSFIPGGQFAIASFEAGEGHLVAAALAVVLSGPGLEAISKGAGIVLKVGAKSFKLPSAVFKAFAKFSDEEKFAVVTALEAAKDDEALAAQLAKLEENPAIKEVEEEAGTAGNELRSAQRAEDAEGLRGVARRTASHDAGVQLGRKFAEETLKLRPTNWVNPLEHSGAFGKGFDDIMEDAQGNLWVVEYKGNSGTLAPGQMEPDWVEGNIALLKGKSPWVPKVQDALDAGQAERSCLAAPRMVHREQRLIIRRWSY